MAYFGKAKKKADAKARKNEKGQPRNEAERRKVNKRLKKKYGYSEHFKPARVKDVGLASGRNRVSTDDAAEIMKMHDKKKGK
jgi:hypothetical protein